MPHHTNVMSGYRSVNFGNLIFFVRVFMNNTTKPWLQPGYSCWFIILTPTILLPLPSLWMFLTSLTLGKIVSSEPSYSVYKDSNQKAGYGYTIPLVIRWLSDRSIISEFIYLSGKCFPLYLKLFHLYHDCQHYGRGNLRNPQPPARCSIITIKYNPILVLQYLTKQFMHVHKRWRIEFSL